MSLTDSQKVTMEIEAESTWGEAIPADGAGGTGLPIEFTTDPALNIARTIGETETLRSDGANTGSTPDSEDIDGELPFEVSRLYPTEGMGLLVAAGLRGAWDTSNTSTITGTTTSVITVVSGAPFEKGQAIHIGSGVNAGVWMIKSKSGNNLTVTETLTSGQTSGTVTGDFLENGTTESSFLVERYLPNAAAGSEYIRSNGVRVGSVGMEVSARAAITGTLGLLAKSTGSPSGATVFGSSGSATVSEKLRGSAHVADVYVDGTAISPTNGGAVRAFGFALTNNLAVDAEVGSRYAAGIGYGKLGVSGTLDAFYEEKSLLDMLLGSTDHELMVLFRDGVGDTGVAVYFPRIVFSQGRPGGQDRRVTTPLSFMTARDSTEACVIRLSSAG